MESQPFHTAHAVNNHLLFLQPVRERNGCRGWKKVTSLMVLTVPSAYGADSAWANADGSVKTAFLKTQFEVDCEREQQILLQI